MAKRFTDTDKWKKQWYLELGSKGRDLWTYLTDNCDHAGIWEINLPLLSFHIGFKVEPDDLVRLLGDKLIQIDHDKLFIPSFFEFQYGTSKTNFKARQSAAALLDRYGLIDSEGFLKESPNSYLTVTGLSMDCPSKSKSIGKGKSKGNKGGLGENENPRSTDDPTEEDFSKAYDAYPKKSGRASGRSRFFREIKTAKDAADLMVAIAAYRKMLSQPENHWLQPKDFTTFLGVNGSAPWRDCLDPLYGSTDLNREDLSKLTSAERQRRGLPVYAKDIGGAQ